MKTTRNQFDLLLELDSEPCDSVQVTSASTAKSKKNVDREQWFAKPSIAKANEPQTFSTPAPPKPMIIPTTPVSVPEIFISICLYIGDAPTILNCSQVCKLWHKYINRNLFHADFYSVLWEGLYTCHFDEHVTGNVQIKQRRITHRYYYQTCQFYYWQQIASHSFSNGTITMNDFIGNSTKKQALSRANNNNKKQSNGSSSRNKDWLQQFKINSKRKTVFKQYFPLVIAQQNAEISANVYVPFAILQCKHKNIKFLKFRNEGRGTVMECLDCTAVIQIQNGVNLKRPNPEKLVWKASVHKINEECNTLLQQGKNFGSSQVEEEFEMNAHIDPYLMYKGDDSIRDVGKICY